VAVLGVNPAAGVLWLALVDEGLLATSVDRVEQPKGMTEGRAWREMLETLIDLLHDTKPETAAVLDPGKYRDLAWKSTRARVALETILTMACDAAGVPVENVAHKTVESVLGARPTDPALGGVLAHLVPDGPPPKWADRLKAAAAAVTVAAGAGP
jgi:hypothetical protein